MERFILGYVVFGIATIVYVWHNFYSKDVIDETFKEVIKLGEADNLPINLQRVLFAGSTVIVIFIYFIFWPKAIYDELLDWYHK